MSRAILMAILLAALALPQVAAETPGAAPNASTAAAPAGTAPSAPPAEPSAGVPPPGRVANCDGFRPSASMDSSAEDKTLLTVHVDVDGLVSNPTLYKSSGDDAYDKAALACAAASFVRRLTHNDVPVAVDGVAAVNWRRGSHGLVMNPAMGSNACVDYFKPSHGMSELSQARPVNVRFQIGEDGAPTNFKIVESSGFDELDQDAIRCIGHWHYYPATHDGKPALIDGGMQIGLGRP